MDRGGADSAPPSLPGLPGRPLQPPRGWEALTLSPWPLRSCHVINATSLTRRKKNTRQMPERVDSVYIIKYEIGSVSAEITAETRISFPVCNFRFRYGRDDFKVSVERGDRRQSSGKEKLGKGSKIKKIRRGGRLCPPPVIGACRYAGARRVNFPAFLYA